MSEYHNNLSKQFLIDYSEVLPVVIDLRSQGLSMQQIANELNKSGYLTREKKPFSSVQVLRILQRARDADPTQPGAQNSVQSVTTDSQPHDEVDQLKIEICALKTQVEEIQQELSELKAQLSELKDKIQLQKSSYVEITVDSQDGKIKPVELMPRQSTKPPRQVDSEIKKSVLQQANQLHSENSELTKSHIAKVLSEKFDVRFETARDWLKKLW